MTLHVQQFGSGPDLVLLHGWGLHSEVFKDVGWQLVSEHRITLIDLPGHGHSPAYHHPGDLAALAEQVIAAAPARAAWLGWSLGGMIAAEAALRTPERISALIWAASSPCFVKRHDWQAAMDSDVLAAFAESLRQDYQGTLDRFLALQAVPGAAGRETLRRLRELLRAFPPPAPQALSDGLSILRNADLRPQLPALHVPMLAILGKSDRLVPPDLGAALTALRPDIRIEIMPGAGHAPFLSHPDAFVAIVSRFLEQCHE
jgi:pimeloyl-[acyl-carrier protein] methyl ester esterase